MDPVMTVLRIDSGSCHGKGKQGFWMFIFPDRKHGDLPKSIKNQFLYREVTSNTQNILKFYN